jgi:hypothetical protein
MSKKNNTETSSKYSVDQLMWIVDTKAKDREALSFLLAHHKGRGKGWQKYEVKPLDYSIRYYYYLFILSVLAYHHLRKDSIENSVLGTMEFDGFPLYANNSVFGQIVKYLYYLKGKKNEFPTIPLDLREGVRETIFKPRSRYNSLISRIKLLLDDDGTDHFLFWEAEGFPAHMFRDQTPTIVDIEKINFPRVPVGIEHLDKIVHQICHIDSWEKWDKGLKHKRHILPTKSEPLNKPPYYVPNKPYYEGLKKHEKLITSSLEMLKHGQMGQLLLLWGMGGIGKSTIAAEIARRYARGKTNQGVLWVQLEVFSSDAGAEAKSLQAQIADTMIVQLGLFDRLCEPTSVKFSALAKEDVLSQIMLVIDNLDPVHHPVDDLAVVLEEIQPGCAIVTSRPSIDLHHTCQIKLTPLDSEDGVRFMKTDASRRNIASVLPKTQKSLAEMCKVTGGLPFAMQLAIGQATRLPWRRILESCIAGQSELYYYLFRDLWKILDPVAQGTLIYMRTSHDGIELDELLAAEKIGSTDQILSAVNELVRLALVDVRGLTESSASYGIHPLTYNFVTTDLPRVWSEEDEKQ